MSKIDYQNIELKLIEAFDRIGYFSDTEEWGNLTDSGRLTLLQARIQIGEVLSELHTDRGHALLPEVFVDSELK